MSLSENELTALEKAVADVIAKKEGKTLSEAGKKTVVADVVREGVAITLPPSMTIDQAITVLRSRQKYEDETTVLRRKFNAFLWDGAVALHRVLERKYGWAEQTAAYRETMFGEKKEKPQMIDVEVDYGKKIQVPFGRMVLPNVQGWVQCEFEWNGKMLVFALKSEVKRIDEATITALYDEVERELRTNSIYKGRAIKIRFLDDDGDPIMPCPVPEFINATAIDENSLIYSDEVMEQVNTNLFTPIKRAVDCIREGIPLKRGVLLGGTYGTGKTLAATVAAKLAVQAGQTFVYVPRANELPYALAFAQQYQSPAAVVFCEDIDRVTSGERSIRMDDILNMLDGIDGKAANIMTILTTNDIDRMNPAMLRPGRLDAVIEVTPPDAKAVERLLRQYARGAIMPDTDLSAAGALLKGQIPAIIAEVVKRAKLAQMAHSEPGEPLSELSEIAIVSAAKSIQSQAGLIERLIEANKPKQADPLSLAVAKVLDDHNYSRYDGILSAARDAEQAGEYAFPEGKFGS